MRKPLKYLIIAVACLLFGWYIWSLVHNALYQKKSDVLRMWTAPNQYQVQFWKKVVDEWNKSGRGIKIIANAIPVAGSSEESILNSIASRTSPDICSNIFSGFGAQLASLEAIHKLKEFDGYDLLIRQREMLGIMESWAYHGGNYVLPIYSSPVLYWWRWDKMQELGCNKIPETYSEVYDFCKLAYIPNKRYGLKLMRFISWWGRWLDFISFYYSASGGKPYMIDDRAAFDNKYGKQVAAFFQKLYDKDYSSKVLSPNREFFYGTVLGSPREPSDIAFAEQNFPEVLNHIKIGPMIVPDNYKGKKCTFADTKGLVIFKQSKHPKEAWKFVKWVFSQDRFSNLWLKLTTMPPARGDLLTNPVFKDYFEKNKMVYEYAKYVNSAVPAAPVTFTIEVQQAMTDQLMEPIIYKTKTADQALKQCVKSINSDLSENE